MKPVLLPATVQLEWIRTGRITPEELAEEHIAQIERVNPLLNAITDFHPERVRMEARTANHGALHGLPVTIKSSIALGGYRCEIGSELYRGEMADADAVAVAALRAQGAVVLGTTNCPELLMAYETDNRLYGPTRNPWNLDFNAGGSSGGEAGAIASGMSAAGLGSDSGGSVRQPAHACGICSLKPTAGRISAFGHRPPCVGPFAKVGAVGPMARTIDDVSLLFEVLASGSQRDPLNVPVALRWPSLDDARQIAIGWIDGDELGPVTPETRDAVAASAQALQKAGFHLQRFRSSYFEQARRVWSVFFVQCGAMFYEPVVRGREHELSPTFRGFLEIARAQEPLTAERLLSAWGEWEQVCRGMLEEMATCPVLLTPVCVIPAFRSGERAWTVEGQEVQYLEAMRFMQWFNVLGSPAAVVPVGQSSQGLPIGVQIAGRPYEDELVLAVARVLDAEFGYRVPPVS